MKQILFSFFLFIACVGFCEEQKLSLKDCIGLALKNSKIIEASKAEVFLAKAGKKEALSFLLPQLSIEGKYEQKNAERDFSVFSEYGGAFSAQTVGVMANWLLFDFGGSWAELRAEKKALIASEMTLERTIQCIEEETKIAYFRTLETKQAIQVMEDSIKILLEQLKITSDFFKQGTISKSDVLFVEVQLGEKKKARLRAKNEYLLASMNLNRLLGKDLTDSFILEDEQQIPSIAIPVERLKKQALKNRSDLKAIQNQLESLNEKKRASKAAYAPRFYAFGGYNYLRDSLSDQKNWISGGIGLQFPLYDGGKTSARGEKIRAQIQEFQARKEELENTILLETCRIFSQLEEEKENIEIDKISLALAEENLKATTDRYKQGLVSIRDLLAAEEQLSQSRMNKAKTLYRAQATYAKLLNVIGGL